jgi:hypothetical protein
MERRITVRMTDPMLADIDAWLSTQPDRLSRQEAVRLCVAFALAHWGGRAQLLNPDPQEGCETHPPEEVVYLDKGSDFPLPMLSAGSGLAGDTSALRREDRRVDSCS